MEIPVSHIHIIDSDTRRRAAMARIIFDLNSHAEIYEDYAEFSIGHPEGGLVLIAGTEAPAVLEMLRDGDVEWPVIVYAEQPDTRDVVEAIQSGALDFVEWPIARQQLSRVVERAAEAGNQLMAQLQKRASARKRVDSLSSRELEVLLGIMTGGSNRSIAEELGISPRTVEIHRGNMMRKLGAGSSGDAVRIALYAGLDNKLDLAA